MHALSRHAVESARKRERFLYASVAALGVKILKFDRAALARGVYRGKERRFVAVRDCRFGLLDAYVFLIVMLCAEQGSRGKFAAQRILRLVEIFGGYVAQKFAAEGFGNALHFGGDCGVIVGEVGVVAARRHDKNAEVAEIPVRALHDGIFEIAEVNHINAADGNRRLVHKSRGLAEVDVFGVLGGTRLENGVQFPVVVIDVEYLGNDQFERTGRRNAASLGDIGVHTGGESAYTRFRSPVEVEHALYERGGGAEFRRPELYVVDVNAHCGVILGLDLDYSVRAGRNGGKRIHADSGGKHFARVVVGVIADYFDSAGRGEKVRVVTAEKLPVLFAKNIVSARVLVCVRAV